MTELTLVIGNKNYSSWSLRPWLAMQQAQLKFTEIRIPLYTPSSRQEILQYSCAGKVPILLHGNVKVWESLAICEYIAENFEPNLWPRDSIPRAIARSVSHEMHAGFQDLRNNMPMNCRARLPGKGMTTSVQKDIDRITEIWRDCRQNYGKEGGFLFGDFTIADAMYAPVVMRFVTYGVQLGAIEQAYVDTILQLRAMQSWLEAASQEQDAIANFEVPL
ncbi:glutathione S-transferase family protein [Candidatus Gracilibacteria bacterium]|jgi:glutathione S-transferase|nr:glutathione S-transferase family protein [Candidatus Gracilibacteria bacterium]NJM87707.1 glutathione S-transferase family protein [Hydrococcus sp. RU_2_2]NJP19413.1 glutathione S-transferase family protein [Hydrococcus sp. CRU_1_1]NJQ96652.1 glutathione S-transferase family protein [Hydrococcus sp. CSU_1_8]